MTKDYLIAINDNESAIGLNNGELNKLMQDVNAFSVSESEIDIMSTKREDLKMPEIFSSMDNFQ